MPSAHAKKQVPMHPKARSAKEGARGKAAGKGGVRKVAAKDSKKGSALSLKEMADALRVLAMDAVERAGSGHPGLPMGAADIATVLFTRFLNFNPRKPHWADRDRFILSAGHGSMLLYGLLYLLGAEELDIKDLKAFRQLGSKTPGHPELGCIAGVETTTGPLGQGLANAVGMALAERMLHARFGSDLVDHKTYVLASDGDLMEGISHEAISLAGHWKLSRLIVLYDDNQVTIDGPSSLADSSDMSKRFEAAGWDCRAVDGHDGEAIASALEEAISSPKPSLILCRTRIGYGAPLKEGKAAAHGAPLGAEEIAGARKKLGWRAKPFQIPPAVMDAWRLAALRGARASLAWEKRLAAAGEETQEAFQDFVSGDMPEDWQKTTAHMKQLFMKEAKGQATRQASGRVLEALLAKVPFLVGGSADLTDSNNARAPKQARISAENYGGRFLHYGVREHGMAAIMNGIALHGGFIPYGGTFLVFSDYCRPALRLSALMKQRVIYLFTHDSIGLGEDGPTHQPVEHLASLRAMPNLRVFRPCDSVEVAECWEAALQYQEGPSALILTRQAVPPVRRAEDNGNKSLRGAYILRSGGGKEEEDVTFLATGSEVSLALEAREILHHDGISCRVVSMPSMELFQAEEEDYQKEVLGKSALRVVLEAGSAASWGHYMREGDIFIGMQSFGASGKAEDLFQHFGITAEAAAEAVLDSLKKRGL